MDQDDPEKRIAELERQMTEARPTGDSTAATGDRLTPEQVHDVAFSKPPIGRRGYNEDQVDAFVALVEEQLRSHEKAVRTAEGRRVALVAAVARGNTLRCSRFQGSGGSADCEPVPCRCVWRGLGRGWLCGAASSDPGWHARQPDWPVR
jgi:DivIVA domain-containing protein